MYCFDISSIRKEEKIDLSWLHWVTWNPQKGKIELLTYGVNEHQFTHCLKIMRLRSQGVGWVINVSNYHEFSEETMVRNCQELCFTAWSSQGGKPLRKFYITFCAGRHKPSYSEKYFYYMESKKYFFLTYQTYSNYSSVTKGFTNSLSHVVGLFSSNLIHL